MAKDINSIFFNITPEIEELALKCEKNNAIEKELYTNCESCGNGKQSIFTRSVKQ